MFTFDSIQEYEMLADILPIPNLVPYSEKPLTFVPAAQADERFLIAGKPLKSGVVPAFSNANLIEGYKANRLTYSFANDAVVLRDTIVDKVDLGTNRFGLRVANFTLQPYSLVGYDGRVTDFEAYFDPRSGVYVFSYIRFAYE